jgi:hypothetical protein
LLTTVTAPSALRSWGNVSLPRWRKIALSSDAW